MKIPRNRKNIKKKNYGSDKIPEECMDKKGHNLWWQLMFKLTPKEQQSIIKTL